jgi:predicted HTH transcriptional regulator
MFETTEEIFEQLLAGEDNFAEFKELRFGDHGVISPNTDDFAGEVAAFANAEGGVLFLGVADDGVIKGIPEEHLRHVEEWVVNITTNNCAPPIRPIIRSMRLPDPSGELKPVLVVTIRKGLYVHQTTRGRWYVRVGSTKRDLTAQELPRLLQERGRMFVFDESPVLTARMDELDTGLVKAVLGKADGIEGAQLLLNKRITLQDEEGVVRPTVAGLLCFSKKPEEHVKSAYIHAAVYRGTRRHSDDLVHQENILGSVQQQIEAAVAFVDRFMMKPSKKDVGREDFPQYRLGAVLEAIVNAIAHRDYSISGSKIRLFMYEDRLEVLSPGGLPNTITLESMRYRQFTRNQLLISFLSKMKSPRDDNVIKGHYIEERGEGVARILDESLEWSGRSPEYALHDQEVALTIWARPENKL